jgi:hypothetical protein
MSEESRGSASARPGALDIEAVTVDSLLGGVSQSRTLIDLSLLVAQIGDAADHSATA